uniref:Ankyrin repeat and SOCS box protein 5-like n=1 Tax=Sinocyclocheilus anshuiensis TaxID=1608454 RepID=A0A671STR6_9TELE
MAVVHAEVNVWSKPWDHRFQLYGRHVCNTLMADSWDDRTPLHDAALQGRLLPLRRLLSQGYNVGMATLDGITPLHEACVGGHFTCAKLLLEHGADANAVSFDGATPLFSACCSGNPALVSLILIYSSVHHPAHLQSSPLYEAAKRGHTACVELLLSHGVNVDMEVPSIGTALYCACESKATECVQSLLISGQNHTHTHTQVCFCEKWGHPIGVMVFILYRPYILLPYTNPTPKPTPHRSHTFVIIQIYVLICHKNAHTHTHHS